MDRFVFAAAAQDAASAAQSTAPAVEEGARLGGQAASFSLAGYIQAIGVLFLILALLWGIVWLMRRYGRFNFLPRPGALPRDALVMEAQMPLGPRKGLMVVRFLNRRLLLGVTDRQITLLTEEKACHEPHGADFRDIMEQVKNGGPAERGLSSADD
ncbi:MAG: flagellar biosynthetic protein FliO [Desulfovibrio sp.]|nr:flagellar biosynthetic protein FliO [Desulfovibrio sp.]